MPKMNSVFGTERLNLAYAIIGAVLAKHKVSEVKELAEQFGYREDEIKSVILNLNNVDPGDHANYFGLPVFFDIDELEDGYVVMVEHNSAINVPRLNTQQTAAITAGLKLLQLTSGFEHNEDIEILLQALHEGSGGMQQDVIQVIPVAPDSDLELLREAILRSVAISCDYTNGKGERSTGRIIEPLRLESRDNFWYLKGFCHNNNEVRNFRLDMMDKVTLTNAAIPEDHKNLTTDGPIYQPGADAIEVLIAVEPEAYQVLTDYNAVWRGAPKLPARGKLQATIKVTSLLTLPPMVASYGGAVQVLEPAEARVLVREFALKALGRQSEIQPAVAD